ncbi:MAG: putative sugar nucleotidyl transferase [bacterium]|nr:putative sugar nucleotidyl transferase [bacterium]
MSELDVAKRLFSETIFGGRNIILFEDEQTGVDLFPLAVLRPSWDIRVGAGCTRRWIEAIAGAGMPVAIRPRAGMEAIAVQLGGASDEDLDPDADLLFVNGRLIGLWPSDELADDLPDTLVDGDGRVLLARRDFRQADVLMRLPGNELARRFVQETGGKPVPEGWRLLSAKFVWDYMLANREVLERQLTHSGRAAGELLGSHALRELPAGVSFAERAAGHPVYAGQGVRLMAGAVIGNHAGPVWIGANTEVEPHTYLEGPLYIGPDCRIKAGTRFYHGCSLGPQCRVAGEISASILQGYVNKQHEGFFGNSHLGRWVNIGADTRTSNLRNDYGQVKVQVGERLIETGESFIGLMAGDHLKTGINTMFNTGTVAGVAANVYGAGYPPRFIPSFTWGGADASKPGSLDRTLQIAREVMPRRGQQLSDAEVELLRRHYAETVKGARES